MKTKNAFISTAIILFVGCLSVSCQNGTIPTGRTQQAGTSVTGISPLSAEDVMIVDCLLPGQVRKLGRSMTYLSARRPVKTTQLDCEIRGGEYVSYDRSDLATALSVWLPRAREGDKMAQTYVGEIYLRGMGTPPDFTLAAEWFKKAARQSYPRAQISLGKLYEQGRGVKKDPGKALALYRRATGLNEILSLDSATPSPEERQELKRLKNEIEQHKQQTGKLRRELDQTLQELEKNRRVFNKQTGKLTNEWQALEAEKAELKHRQEADRISSLEFNELTKKLNLRDTELKSRRKDIASLQQKITDQETKIQSYHQETDQFKRQLAALPPPLIEIYDPKPVATRGAVALLATVARGLSKRQITGRVWAPAGLSAFWINTKQQSTDLSGKFKVWVPLSSNEKTDIQIVAVDTNGKESKFSFQLEPDNTSLTSIKGKTEVISYDFGEFYALIIGNNEYLQLPKLSTAVNDARAVAEVLKTQYGFQTTLLTNLNRNEILIELDKFRKKLTQKDNFLLYYAGHGELDTANNRGYWLPVNAAKNSSVEWIRTDRITDMLNLMESKRTLVIADTCYSGIMTRSALTSLETGASSEKRYSLIKKLAEKRARVVLSSGGLMPVLDSGIGNHSVYAGSLLKVLETNHDILRARELHDEVTREVAYASERLGLEQIPQYGGLIQSGHEMGDFIFKPQERAKQTKYIRPFHNKITHYRTTSSH